MFTKFIEERSFVSDTNAYHAFFDECVERAESAAANPDPAADRLVFLELEVSDSDRTVFILPPDIRDARSVGKYTRFCIGTIFGRFFTNSRGDKVNRKWCF